MESIDDANYQGEPDFLILLQGSVAVPLFVVAVISCGQDCRR